MIINYYLVSWNPSNILEISQLLRLSFRIQLLAALAVGIPADSYSSPSDSVTHFSSICASGQVCLHLQFTFFFTPSSVKTRNLVDVTGHDDVSWKKEVWMHSFAERLAEGRSCPKNRPFRWQSWRLLLQVWMVHCSYKLTNWLFIWENWMFSLILKPYDCNQ